MWGNSSVGWNVCLTQQIHCQLCMQLVAPKEADEVSVCHTADSLSTLHAADSSEGSSRAVAIILICQVTLNVGR